MPYRRRPNPTAGSATDDFDLNTAPTATAATAAAAPVSDHADEAAEESAAATVFQLDTTGTIAWAATSGDIDSAIPVAPSFADPAVEREYSRYLTSTGRVEAVGVFIALGVASIFGGVTSPSIGTFRQAAWAGAGGLFMLFAVAELAACVLKGAPTIELQHVRAKRHEYIQAIGWSVPNLIVRLVIIIGDRACPESWDPRFGTFESACLRSFRGAHAAYMVVSAVMIRNPAHAMVAVLLQALADVADPIANPEDSESFAYRFVVTLVFAAFLCLLNVFRDRGDRAAFQDLIQLHTTRLELQGQRDTLEAVVRAALPQRLVRRLARLARRGDGSLPLEQLADARRDAVVVAASAVGFGVLATAQLLRRTIADLHALFTVFDAALEAFGLDPAGVQGDTYVAASGLLQGSRPDALAAISFAWWQVNVKAQQAERLPLHAAVACGAVAGAVAGSSKLRYVVAGPAVEAAVAALPRVPERTVWASRGAVEQVLPTPRPSVHSTPRVGATPRSESDVPACAAFDFVDTAAASNLVSQSLTMATLRRIGQPSPRDSSAPSPPRGESAAPALESPPVAMELDVVEDASRLFSVDPSVPASCLRTLEAPPHLNRLSQPNRAAIDFSSSSNSAWLAVVPRSEKALMRSGHTTGAMRSVLSFASFTGTPHPNSAVPADADDDDEEPRSVTQALPTAAMSNPLSVRFVSAANTGGAELTPRQDVAAASVDSGSGLSGSITGAFLADADFTHASTLKRFGHELTVGGCLTDPEEEACYVNFRLAYVARLCSLVFRVLGAFTFLLIIIAVVERLVDPDIAFGSSTSVEAAAWTFLGLVKVICIGARISIDRALARQLEAGAAVTVAGDGDEVSRGGSDASHPAAYGSDAQLVTTAGHSAAPTDTTSTNAQQLNTTSDDLNTMLQTDGAVLDAITAPADVGDRPITRRPLLGSSTSVAKEDVRFDDVASGSKGGATADADDDVAAIFRGYGGGQANDARAAPLGRAVQIAFFVGCTTLIVGLFLLQRSVITNSPQFVAFILIPMAAEVLAPERWWASALLVAGLIVVPFNVLTWYHLGTFNGAFAGIALAHLGVTVWASRTASHTGRLRGALRLEARDQVAAVASNAEALTVMVDQLVPLHVARECIAVLRKDERTRAELMWKTMSLQDRLHNLMGRRMPLGLEDFVPDFVCMSVLFLPPQASSNAASDLRMTPSGVSVSESSRRGLGQSQCSDSDAFDNTLGESALAATLDSEARAAEGRPPPPPPSAAAQLIARWAAIERTVDAASAHDLHLVSTLGDAFTVGGPFVASEAAERRTVEACVRLLATLAHMLPEVPFAAAGVIEEAFGALVGEARLRYRMFGIAPLHSAELLAEAAATQRAFLIQAVASSPNRRAPKTVAHRQVTRFGVFTRRFATRLGGDELAALGPSHREPLRLPQALKEPTGPMADVASVALEPQQWRLRAMGCQAVYPVRFVNAKDSEESQR